MAADLRAADFASGDAHHVGRGQVDVDAHAFEHVGDRACPVALLVREPSGSPQRRGALAGGCERRQRGEEVGAVRGIEFESVQRAAADRDRVGGRRDLGSGASQRIDDGHIGL